VFSLSFWACFGERKRLASIFLLTTQIFLASFDKNKGIMSQYPKVLNPTEDDSMLCDDNLIGFVCFEWRCCVACDEIVV
jgi:hypothetical protein